MCGYCAARWSGLIGLKFLTVGRPKVSDLFYLGSNHTLTLPASQAVSGSSWPFNYDLSRQLMWAWAKERLDSFAEGPWWPRFGWRRYGVYSDFRLLGRIVWCDQKVTCLWITILVAWYSVVFGSEACYDGSGYRLLCINGTRSRRRRFQRPGRENGIGNYQLWFKDNGVHSWCRGSNLGLACMFIK